MHFIQRPLADLNRPGTPELCLSAAPQNSSPRNRPRAALTSFLSLPRHFFPAFFTRSSCTRGAFSSGFISGKRLADTAKQEAERARATLWNIFHTAWQNTYKYFYVFCCFTRADANRVFTARCRYIRLLSLPRVIVSARVNSYFAYSTQRCRSGYKIAE